MLMRKILPRGAVGAVILAHGAPLALREIRPPAFPMALAGPRLFQPLVLDRLNAGHSVASSANRDLSSHSLIHKSFEGYRFSCPAGHVEHTSRPLLHWWLPLVYRAALVGGTFRYILKRRLTR